MRGAVGLERSSIPFGIARQNDIASADPPSLDPRPAQVGGGGEPVWPRADDRDIRAGP